ncbi:porin family protein [Gemmatimonas sp.]|jgi:hypothetical protein|uniref:porin family protein n=1 Tax=Gemmatimonas sp. TaxID=1962908 RepID=UPI0037BF5BB5
MLFLQRSCSKSYRVILAVCTTLLLPLLATPLAAQRWSVGVLAGANRSTVGGSDADQMESLIGVAGGVQLMRTLNDYVALEVDGLYSPKGASMKNQGAAADVRLRYLEVPLLLHLGPSPRSTVRPFVTLGASAGVLLSCTARERANGTSVSADCDQLADFQNVDATLIGGAGLDARLGPGTMTLTVRYGYGVRNIVSEAELQNRTFSFLAGWRIPFGRTPVLPPK